MSSSTAAAAARKPAAISPIRQEYKRLQEVESLLSEIWHREVQAYEQHDSAALTASVAALDTSALSSYGGHRNHPNIDGTIGDSLVFPYHDALYPLLDCYDSIKQDNDDGGTNLKSATVSPSEAPNPFAQNGHRRSKFSPRLDPRGFHIEELDFLEGHLPNSAWAIRETLMPLERKEGYLQYMSQGRQGDDEEITQVVQRHGEDDEIAAPPKHRFWKVLMNNRPKLTSSSVSLAPDDDESGEHQFDIEMQMAQNARDFTFLTWWENELVSNPSFESSESRVEATSSPGEYSVECLFATAPNDANFILLKVLKHAMSDLQRDFRLARAVLLLVADWKLCEVNNSETQSEGIETLRRLLLIISSEYIHCSGSCHEWYLENGGVNHGPGGRNGHDHVELFSDGSESIDLEVESDEDNDDWEDHNNATLNDSRVLDSPTHYCSDWFQFLGSLSTVIAYGISFMTQQHTSVICACVLREIDYMVGIDLTNRDTASGSESDNGEATADKSASFNARYKGYLKQTLFVLNNSESTGRSGGGQESSSLEIKGRQFRVNFVIALVNGLKRHALVHRERLETVSQDLIASPDQDLIKQPMNSFKVCVEAMVDIGERMLLKLPTNATTCLLGGVIVRALLEVHLKSDVLSTINEDHLYIAQNGNSGLRSMIDPLRYADAISNASSNQFLNPNIKHESNGDKLGVERLSRVMDQPSQDVQDIVQALFVRDLVDLRISGFGYGDFSVWFGLPLSPNDVQYFFFYRNLPYISSSEVWAKDEEGADLDYNGLMARYDFTLMLFLREWNAPWSAESHHSFSIPFRSAIRELALCAHRFGVPSDIVAIVNSFLPRSSWPDDRTSCWCRDCQLLRLRDQYKAKISSRQSNWSDYDLASFTRFESPDNRPKTSSPLLTCKCSVVRACSKDHMKYIFQEGHKRYCGLPPFRPFTDDDHQICRDILDGPDLLNRFNPLEAELTEGDLNEDDNSCDEDDEWESVDSEESFSEKKTVSEKLLKYFEEQSYRHSRRETLPFEDFF